MDKGASESFSSLLGNCIHSKVCHEKLYASSWPGNLEHQSYFTFVHFDNICVGTAV